MHNCFAGGGRAGWRRIAAGLLLATALGGGASAQTVPTYHAAANRSGNYVAPGLTYAAAAGLHPDTAFHGVVSGKVYAQPLYWQSPDGKTRLVIVATEADIVYGLDAATGAVKWQKALGTPVDISALPCGDIDPLGITGTPVIDTATDTLYLDAMIGTSAGPRHRIFALAAATGRVLPGWPVGVQGGVDALHDAFTSETQNQRSALTIADGHLYVAYGANAGDCGTYHGLVAELALGTPAITAVWTTRASGGGIWSQGGVVFDGQSMFVATGNTFNAETWGDGEAVFRLTTGLKHALNKALFYTPENWKDLDNSDLDLGGTAPLPIVVPVPGGVARADVMAFGKDGNAYLLNRGNLGGLGGQIAVADVSSGALITGPATYRTATAAMVAVLGNGAACPTGQSGNLLMLKVTSDPVTPIRTAWCVNVGTNGAPIVTTRDGDLDPIVWIAGTFDGALHGFRGSDGAKVYSGGSLSGLQRNTTILVAGGRLYVAGADHVYAFAY